MLKIMCQKMFGHDAVQNQKSLKKQFNQATCLHLSVEAKLFNLILSPLDYIQIDS